MSRNAGSKVIKFIACITTGIINYQTIIVHIIIVFGEKPLRSGQMHPELKLRLNKALDIIKQTGGDLLIITGGQTRSNTQTEAEMGLAYVNNKTTTPILLEKNARSTSENIRYTKQLLSDNHLSATENFSVVTGQKRIWREKYLFRKLWAEAFPRTTFYGATDLHSFWYYGVELPYFLFAIMDPQERYLARLTKKVFRNSTI
jgi:hypothetical protein